MKEIYSQLSQEEQRILKQYHQRGRDYLVNESELKLKNQEENENWENSEISYRSEAPVRVLQTKVFNDSQRVLKPQEPKVVISKKIRSASTPKRKKTPTKVNSVLNTSKGSKGRSSSRKNSVSRIKGQSRNKSGSKVLDITRMPNWKYEVNKLIRTVYRHSVLCRSFKEESSKLGGLKILEEYKRFNKS